MYLSRNYTSDFLLAMVMLFFLIVASPARGGGYIWRQIFTKSVILSHKIQVIEFLAIFFCDFQLSHHLYKGGYMCDFRCALATRQILNKIASRSQAKNRFFSRGFKKMSNLPRSGERTNKGGKKEI